MIKNSWFQSPPAFFLNDGGVISVRFYVSWGYINRIEISTTESCGERVICYENKTRRQELNLDNCISYIEKEEMFEKK